MNLDTASTDQLRQLEQQLSAQYDAFVGQKLSLDLTRGKPSSEQLDLSNQLDGILHGDYKSQDGTDTRNYGGGDGLPEARALGAAILGLRPEEVLAQGNSSLTLMFQALLTAHNFGFTGADSAWALQGNIKFLCPVPGYDRHFTLCEQLGIEMIAVNMTATGPDMDQVEALLKADPSIKGIWCVPKYSNPTGVVYSTSTVDRIARLGLIAGAGFRVFWDNAYAVHDLAAPHALANIMDSCRALGTEDSVIQFASTSKITHASAGVAFIGMSENNLKGYRKFCSAMSIGPDKVNQLRHMRLLPDVDALHALMRKHAALLQPRFKAVLSALNAAFGDNDLGRWETPAGGYFVSFDTRPGCAVEVVKLAANAGVKLTPAGAPFPYGRDPNDSNIRLAPSVPTVDQVVAAMEVFVTCIKLVAVRQQLAQR